MWAARIPAIQENLALGVGTLGLALLGGGLGTLLIMLPAGALIARRGSRLVTRLAALPMAISLAGLALATDALTLFAAMVVWGASNAALDVAMNAQGSTHEQRHDQPIMSSLHGLWSLGTMAGAALGAFVAGLGISVRVHFLVAAPVLFVALLLAAEPFASDDGHQDVGVRFAWPRGALLALAALVFCAVGTEGAMFDWAAVTCGVSSPRLKRRPDSPRRSLGRHGGRPLGGDQLTARVSAPWLPECARSSLGWASARSSWPRHRGRFRRPDLRRARPVGARAARFRRGRTQR